jgi:hypothetical protein
LGAGVEQLDAGALRSGVPLRTWMKMWVSK